MAFHIIVCIKAVVTKTPDRKVIRSAETCELNPFDRPVIESALRLKEQIGATVTALTMGPKDSVFALYEAMAMGVDRGILVSDPILAGSDTLITSLVLSKAIEKLAPFDLALFGVRTADSDTGQVGPQTAVLLDLPCVTWVRSIEKSDQALKVERSLDEYTETYEVPMPAALTIHPGVLAPRDISLSGIETAFQNSQIETWDAKALDLTPEQVGEANSPTRVIRMQRIKKDRKCELVPGPIEEQAQTLTQKLLKLGLIG